jgi:hypothetical protein
MRLSLVFLDAARRGTAFFVIVEAKTKFPLPSPNGSVDQRKSPSRYPRIGSEICSHRILWNVPRVMSAVAAIRGHGWESCGCRKSADNGFVHRSN